MSNYPAWGDYDFEHLLIEYLKRISISLEKMENKMPVPEGDITTSEILTPTVEEVVEDSTTEDEDDLQELS